MSHIVVKPCRRSRSATALVLPCVLLAAAFGLGRQAPARGAAAPRFQKILILGNSITRHGPAPKIGWLGNWGMAASAEQKDFAHLVASSLANSSETAPELMVENIAQFERNYGTYDVDAKLKDAVAFRADLVIVAIGENVPSLASAEAQAQFRSSVGKLLRGLKADGSPTLVVRSCFWPNKAKDEALRQACREVGGIYVDIGPLGKDRANFAIAERPYKHEGVGRHPGDKGMQAIATAILEAINTQKDKETHK